MNVADRIKGYIDRVEDIQYLEDILNEVSRQELFQTLLALLQSSSANDIAKTDIFIRDVIYRTTDKIRFRQQFIEAGLATAYVGNIVSKNYFIRRTSLGTLRTCFDDCWPQKDIETAIAFFESNDPIMLADLTKHSLFRSRWEDWSLPKRLLSSKDFLVRWSVIESLDHILRFPLPNDAILSGAKSCLEKIRQDEKEVVWTEADFLCNRVKNYEMMLNLPKLEKRKLSKALDKTTPKVRFESFWLFVSRELSARQKEDFTMPELHEMAEAFQNQDK